jgi:hypothetical protein
MGCCVSLSVNCAGLSYWSSTRLATCRSPQAAAICSSSSSTGYETGLTSNRGFAEQGEIFGDPVVATVLLDCWLHHRSKDQAIGCVSTPISCPSTFTPPRRRRHPAPDRQERSRKIAKKAHRRPNPTRPVPSSCVRAISRAGVCPNFAALGACNSL